MARRRHSLPEAFGNLPEWMRRTAQTVNELLLEHEAHYEDLRFPAQALNLGGAGATAPTIEADPALWPGTLLFSGTLDKVIVGIAQMPHGWREETPIVPHVHVAKTTASAAAMTWELYYRRANAAGAPFEAWQGPVAGAPVPSDPGVADQPYMYSFGEIAMAGYKISALVAWRVYRRGSTDAYGSDARLFEFDIHYENDAFGSDDEFTKHTSARRLR